MTSAEIQRMILDELAHGVSDHFQVAANIDQAPFRVRAELKAMRRDRLVRERTTIEAHDWSLTPRGWTVLNSQAQGRFAV